LQAKNISLGLEKRGYSPKISRRLCANNKSGGERIWGWKHRWPRHWKCSKNGAEYLHVSGWIDVFLSRYFGWV